MTWVGIIKLVMNKSKTQVFYNIEFKYFLINLYIFEFIIILFTLYIIFIF